MISAPLNVRASSALAPASVLVIDDDEDIRVIYPKLIEHFGLDCRCAADWESGQRALEQQLPDVVLLDVLIPQVSGAEILRSLKADRRYRDLPVIMISSANIQLIVADMRAAGACLILEKPIPSDALIAAILSVAASRDPV